MDRLLPHGSRKRREYFLPDHLRGALAYHRERTAAYTSAAEKTHPEPSAIYAALLDGTLEMPVMPKVLREALGLVDPPLLTADMNNVDIWEAYRSFVHGDDK
ncbi:hypothetical protein [Qipengyuania spongiae]|uniref:Uncharacterized protein n=1 Tax=Qipengyuania spongiae TaxID=2909673 RepID=A0ABY5SX30_9SPHN|nr:hypothetical protein [Qipengyuania spongiae]UVI39107.1 hypothetical protein L1F33_12855 [Qipengyuania spongiae]